MNMDQLPHQLPLWSIYSITVVVVLISIVSGFLLGNMIRRRGKNTQETPTGIVVGALLGLLAFLLAFTFGMAGSRFDSRRQLLLDEANAIGTAFLRADFLPDAERAETKNLLRKYVDIRLEAARQIEKIPQALADSEALHDRLWSQVAPLSKRANDKILLGLYIQSLNEVIDLHANRAALSIQYRIPGSIWLALYVVSIMTMVSVGYHFGLTGGGSFLITLLLSFAFSTVILLIADLDRTHEGVLKVSQKPMMELQKKMNASVK